MLNFNRALVIKYYVWFALFFVQTVEGLYYPCSENKGADQLCGDRTADLRLCFRMYKKKHFLTTRLISLLARPLNGPRGYIIKCTHSCVSN